MASDMRERVVKLAPGLPGAIDMNALLKPELNDRLCRPDARPVTVVATLYVKSVAVSEGGQRWTVTLGVGEIQAPSGNDLDNAVAIMWRARPDAGQLDMLEGLR